MSEPQAPVYTAEQAEQNKLKRAYLDGYYKGCQDTQKAAPRWVSCEEHPPKPGCYLTASPTFYGEDCSWLLRLAWWTEHGLIDFVYDAEKESGWYIWNHDQDRDTEIEPMYWMPIEPPREDV